MGASSSKVAGKAAAAAGRRQYPSTSSILNSAPSTSNNPSTSNPSRQAPKPFAPSQVHPEPSQAPPQDTNTQQVELDGRDPQFGSRLSRLGAARPVEQARLQDGAFPTSSQSPVGQHGQNIFPSSLASQNPAVMLVQARNQIGKKWDEESESLGRGSFQGRTLINAKEIREAVRMRDEGRDVREIERQMRLRPGLLEVLAARGIIGNA